VQGRSFDVLMVRDHPPDMDAEAILMELRCKQNQIPHVFCLRWQRHSDERDVERLRSAGATTVICAQNYLSVVEEVKFSLQLPKAGLPKAI
jgi:predicted amidohydrolase